MIGRGVVFVAGVGVGVYGMVKARRAAEAVTPDGIRDRLSALSLGAHLLREEVQAGMTQREGELRQRLGLALDNVPALESRSTPELEGH